MKKGFTLIELLAVIVILAIIALIATPIILGVVENSKKGAAKSSALGYVDTVEKQMLIGQLSETEELADGNYILPLDNKYDVKIKGSSPTKGNITINKNKIIYAEMCINDYLISYNDGKTEILGKCNENTNLGPTKNITDLYSTSKVKQLGVLGIAYLNPTNLTATCNENNSTMGSGTTGCMKWYIYDDDGTNYKLILDHNTENKIVWSNSGHNVAYESSNAHTLIQNLISNNNWESVLNPTIITVDEINKIVNKTTFDSANWKNWYYFDDPNKGQTQTAKSQGASAYAWLYDYTFQCKINGCDTEISSQDAAGYWTQNPTGAAGEGSSMWFVYKMGYLYSGSVNTPVVGIRPVVTVSKAIFK